MTQKPEAVKQPRLSDESTEPSESDDEGQLVPPPLHPADLLEDDDKMMEYLMSFPEIAGRYTDEDPAYFYEEAEGEKTTPPIVTSYRPRQYRQDQRGPYQGGGGDYQNHRHQNNHQHNNQFQDQQNRGHTRKWDHSHSNRPDSQFYARPPTGGYRQQQGQQSHGSHSRHQQNSEDN